MVGGAGASKPRLAQVLFEGLSTQEALAAIEKVITFYQNNGKKLERIGKMLDRVGFDHFKDTIQKA